MNKSVNSGQSFSAFTIIELLIVIVIIGILTSITVVVYGNFINSAKDAAISSSVKQLQSALELHLIKEGAYPSVCFDENGTHVENPSWTLGCDAKFLEPSLVPKYLNKMSDTSNINYAVGGYTSQVKDGYGLLLEYPGKGKCRILGGRNPSDRWWSSSPLCNDI